jgi:hypothetical protein
MVHLARLLFLSVSLVTIVFGNLLKRTVTQIEGDIANISSLVNILCDDINGFPASGLAGALVINAAAYPSRPGLHAATYVEHSSGGRELGNRIQHCHKRY